MAEIPGLCEPPESFLEIFLIPSQFGGLRLRPGGQRGPATWYGHTALG